MKEIYLWWVDFDEEAWYENSPWYKHCEQMREKYGCSLSSLRKQDEEESKQSKIALEEHTRLEKENKDKITEMLCRLMRVRGGMWC